MMEVGRVIRKELRRLSAAETASGLGGINTFPERFLGFWVSLLGGSTGYSARYRIWRM